MRSTSRIVFAGDVREVDDHADAVHLGDDLLAKLAEADARGVGRAALVLGEALVDAGLGPGDGAGVGERHVGDAHLLELTEERERAVEDVAALEADEGGDFASLPGGGGVGGGAAEAGLVGVDFGDALDQIDLLQDSFGGLLERMAGHPGGPELALDTALAHAGEIGVEMKIDA
jgi:hypothetical protein